MIALRQLTVCFGVDVDLEQVRADTGIRNEEDRAPVRRPVRGVNLVREVGQQHARFTAHRGNREQVVVVVRFALFIDVGEEQDGRAVRRQLRAYLGKVVVGNLLPVVAVAVEHVDLRVEGRIQ